MNLAIWDIESSSASTDFGRIIDVSKFISRKSKKI